MTFVLMPGSYQTAASRRSQAPAAGQWSQPLPRASDGTPGPVEAPYRWGTLVERPAISLGSDGYQIVSTNDVRSSPRCSETMG